MMACDFGILDVDHKHIKRSIKRCFVRASKHIDAERYEITRGIKRLQLFVEQAPRVSKGDNVRSDCKGFVRINKGNSVLVISRQHFIGLYEGRLQARLVAKHLSLAGDIAAEAPEPLPVSLDWAEEQVNWPFKTGSKRVRSICIAINN
jgi:translation elongation factor EF-1beta